MTMLVNSNIKTFHWLWQSSGHSIYPRRHRYGSCLLTQANISRLGLCLVRIALKLRRFRKPTFIGLKSGVRCTTYLTSISQAITNQYLSVWNVGVGYTPNWKSYCTLKNNSTLTKTSLFYLYFIPILLLSYLF